MTRVAVLGSTGSIGRSTLDVIAGRPEQLRLVGVAARSRTDALVAQCRAFSPSIIAVWDAQHAKTVSEALGGREIPTGLDGLIQVATHPDVDVVVVATSGRDALLPLVRAVQAGKRIALASKELLVMAGEIIMSLVREHGTRLVPIDSEHAALLQCLQGVRLADVAQLVVTGSGGPLWDLPASEFATVTREQVLAHPKWRMGSKITVDSATLMNKGLEVIEAHWLFQVPVDRIRVVIHPEAAVHALVELVDGTLLAQLSACDMRLPIQYALSMPERWANRLPRLDVGQLSTLRFQEPDLNRFVCLRLALAVAREGGSRCIVLNAANEAAVHAYLDGQIPFVEIPRVIEETLAQHAPITHPALDDVLAIDGWSRDTAQECIRQCSIRS